MNIAIASETEEIDGLVPATFKESPFLMIIDADKNQIFHVYGKQDPDNLVFAKKVVEHDCEAVICGPNEKEPFEKTGLKEENLSKQDKKILQGGYAVRTEKELYSVLENFSS